MVQCMQTDFDICLQATIPRKYSDIGFNGQVILQVIHFTCIKRRIYTCPKNLLKFTLIPTIDQILKQNVISIF